MLLDTQIEDSLPYNDYFEYCGPDYKLHIPPSNMENLNTKPYLEETKIKLFEQLRQVQPVGCPIQTGQMGNQTAPDVPIPEATQESDPDARPTQAELEGKREHPAEFYPPEAGSDQPQPPVKASV